jgi:uncharacterized protein (TIGR00297 family)
LSGVSAEATPAAALLGTLAGIGVAVTAWRRGALTRNGAVTAIALGAASAVAGAGWAALLILYFVGGTAISRLGESRKRRRTDATVAKGGARDAWQVLANGGVFGALALASSLGVSAPAVAAAAAGALAASTADTWATEIGTWLGGTPRHVLTWRPIAPGMSGGVTVAGTIASGVGACWLAGLAWLLGWPTAAVVPIALGGVLGALADTLLGASAQQVRYCPTCALETEQPVHRCGTATTVRRGASWIGNDAVNLAATVVGAVSSGLACWWEVAGWSAR